MILHVFHQFAVLKLNVTHLGVRSLNCAILEIILSEDQVPYVSKRQLLITLNLPCPSQCSPNIPELSHFILLSIFSCYDDSSKKRNRLIMPSLISGRVYIFDVETDPRAPRIHKVTLLESHL